MIVFKYIYNLERHKQTQYLLAKLSLVDYNDNYLPFFRIFKFYKEITISELPNNVSLQYFRTRKWNDCY